MITIKDYKTPTIEIIEISLEGTILTASEDDTEDITNGDQQSAGWV